MTALGKWASVGVFVVVGLSSAPSHGQIWMPTVLQQNVAPQLVSAETLPAFGTFWLLTRTNSAPLPFYAPYLREVNAPVYLLDAQQGIFLVDDSVVDYVALDQQREAERVLRQLEWENGLLSDEEYWALEGGGSSAMMMSSLSSSYAYGNPVCLVDMEATNTGPQTTASFSIAGGTNNVPYDILTATNLTSPLADWQWLGIGYPSNRYAFANQPSAQAFYILAKPQKTMVVSRGNNDDAQAEVPFGITNAVMVAGGERHSLALLNNGNVIGWGSNNFGQLNIPTNLAGVAMIAAAQYHSVALLTNGTVTAWGWNGTGIYDRLTDVPPDLTNAVVISAQALHSLALRSNGTVVAWGYSALNETNVPAGLSNVIAIAAGGQHSLAAKSDGTVVAWGYDNVGQCTVPAGLSNVMDVAAGWRHSVALRRDGTVVAWGDNSYGQTNVPATLSNVVAIAAGGDGQILGSAYTLALRKDGTMVAWGTSVVNTPMIGLSNVIAIAGGDKHGLVIRSGPRTPVLTLVPIDQYKIAGSDVMFSSRGAGLYGVGYQWKTNGVNLAGATNATLTLTNVQAAQAVDYTVTVSNEVGTITSPNAHLYLVSPPVITSITLPTNQVINYGKHVSLGVTASAPGDTNGFPLSYQWKLNGTNISGAISNAYGFFATDDTAGDYSITVANAVGSTNVHWWITVTNDINVTNELLLIYNSTSTNSTSVKDYYLAHRPMVTGANALGISCATNEVIASADFTNQVLNAFTNWLGQNLTKRPQYIIWFYDLPGRVEDTNVVFASPSYYLHTVLPDYRPYVTCINMRTINDCKAYIDKLVAFGTNNSLFISARADGYGNTNYIFDNIRHGTGYGIPGYDANYSASTVISSATNGLIAAGVETSAIRFFDGLETLSTNGVPSNLPHPTGLTNPAGYACWGAHSSLSANYATNGEVILGGESTWWIIETIESYNGQRDNPYTGQSNFLHWFSPNAFGGANYSNTPVGAVSHVEEPVLPNVNDSSLYFGLWAQERCFAICAWRSRNTPFTQAVGDPFVRK